MSREVARASGEAAVRRLFASMAIERDGADAPYRQIARLIHDAVVAGRLRSGTRLPAERELAGLLGVGRGTVARALTELGDTGLLERRVGHGTIVAFDLESWRSGPTPGIPWGALLNALGPASSRARAEEAERRAELAAGLELGDRDGESLVLTGSLEAGTRFLVDALVAEGERVIVEAPAAPALALSLAMRRAEVIEVAPSAGREGLAASLERLLEADPGAKLAWLRAGSRLRRRGDRAHIAGLTKRLGLPVVEEPPNVRAAGGLLAVEPHDHLVRLAEGWISAPAPLARLLRPLALELGMGRTSDG